VRAEIVKAGEIDLASTAVCIIDWSETPAQIVEPIGKDHWTDEALLDLLESEPEARVAIDASFGWRSSSPSL
jgi:hypothetical protein